jgi:hypothetical protein
MQGPHQVAQKEITVILPESTKLRKSTDSPSMVSTFMEGTVSCAERVLTNNKDSAIRKNPGFIYTNLFILGDVWRLFR